MTTEPPEPAAPRATPVALVAGASSGIGRAIAVAFGELGWSVGLGGRRPEALTEAAAAVRAAGGHAVTRPLDVTDPDSVGQWFAAMDTDLAPLDVLVNNAGIAVPGRFHEVAPADIEREVRTNLLGAMLCTQCAVARLLKRRAPGDVVFVSSDASERVRPWMATYSATKAALEVLSRTLNLELEGSGVRCTVVRVGPTLTDFAASWDHDTVTQMMRDWPQYGLQRHMATMEPRDVAHAVVAAVTMRRGVHVERIEVQPEPPRR